MKKISLAVDTVRVGQMQTNAYIVYGSGAKDAVIIDPGDDAEYLEDYLTHHSFRPQAVVATHGHFDHILAAFALQKAYTIPFLMHQRDAFLLSHMQRSAQHFLGVDAVDPPPQPSKWLKENDTIGVGSGFVLVLEVPGHTPGSVALYCPDGQWIIVGDVLFEDGGVGRTDFSYADGAMLKTSLARILALPPTTTIYPGHGGKTTVRRERHFRSFD